MKIIEEGGVCAAKGFSAASVHAGIRSRTNDREDLALIMSDTLCTAAGVYTKNVVKAAPILIDLEHLKDGVARGIIANSGNANACAPNDIENAHRMCAAAARTIGCRTEDILVASTGVIGQTLNIQAIENQIRPLCDSLEASPTASSIAAYAIMTTDTKQKEIAVETTINGATVHIGGIAKGSGMIHPNMGTMLCFITTDCAISSKMLRAALGEAVQVSFNRISVDGDTSTNDTCILLANGLAENTPIEKKDEAYKTFVAALKEVCIDLARKIALDGEGAKHLITCTVSGAEDEKSAEAIAKSVISSTLTKAAIFGADANWGRVLCAMGYSGEEFNPNKVDIAFASSVGEIDVCKQGRGLDFDEDMAKKILTEHDIEIKITMGEGEEECTCWGCDITYDYIKINGDYRT